MLENRPTEGENVADRIAYAIIRTGHDPWQFQAACVNKPHLTDATRAPQVWEALTLCASCPVVQQCLRWATAEEDYVGVAGGRIFTARRRARTQRQQNAKAG